MALRHQLRDGEEGPPHVVKRLKRWARRKDKRTLKRAAEPPMEQQPAPKRAAGVRSQAAAAQERKQLRREEQALLPRDMRGRAPRPQWDPAAERMLHPELGRVGVQQQELGAVR